MSWLKVLTVEHTEFNPLSLLMCIVKFFVFVTRVDLLLCVTYVPCCCIFPFRWQFTLDRSWTFASQQTSCWHWLQISRPQSHIFADTSVLLCSCPLIGWKLSGSTARWEFLICRNPWLRSHWNPKCVSIFLNLIVSGSMNVWFCVNSNKQQQHEFSWLWRRWFQSDSNLIFTNATSELTHWLTAAGDLDGQFIQLDGHRDWNDQKHIQKCQAWLVTSSCYFDVAKPLAVQWSLQ